MQIGIVARKIAKPWTLTHVAGLSLGEYTAHVVAAIFAEVLGRPSFGTRDDFFERVEPEDGEHGAEYLFGGDRLRLVARREDRRREIVAAGQRGIARAGATQERLDAVGVGLGGEALDALAVRGRDQGSSRSRRLP